MIRIDSFALYSAALQELRRFRGPGYLGRLVQIFLAAKYYGAAIPRIGDATGLDGNTLQRLLDELYSKPSLAPESVAILFNDNHLAPTGITASGRSTGSNIWRNNFNIQKGYGCFASSEELKNATFRVRSRTLCPHLVPATRGTLSGARCALDNSDATYRNEDHPKMLRIDPESRDVWIYDPSDILYYESILRNSSGFRVPIAPLIVALYFDSPMAAGRSAIDIADFMLDFSIGPGELAAYFDDDPSAPTQAAFVAAHPGDLTWTRVSSVATMPPIGGITTPKRREAPSPSPSISTVTPPAGSFWWNAEQAVRLLLERDGWMVTDKTRLGVGFDLLAFRSGVTRHIEVKSSAGKCSPSLTPNEYFAARTSRTAYFLALVEDYHPTSPLSVQWVQDPARLLFTRRTSETFALPRSQWKRNTLGALA